MSVSTAASDPPRLRAGALSAGAFVAVLLGGGLASGGPPAGFGQLPNDPASRQVESVTVVWADGSVEPVPEAVSRLISVRPGARLRPLAVRESVKQIFALGRFRDVRVLPHTTPAGRLGLVFELDPIPRVARMEIHGAPRGEIEDLTAALAIEIGEPLPDLRLRAEAAEAWLRSIGYLAAEIEIRSTAAGRDLVLEAFLDPGPRAQVVSLRVEGVPPALGGELRRTLGISTGRPWSEVEIEARLPAVQQLLRDRGFLASTARLDFDVVNPAEVRLRLMVDAGPEIRIALEGPGSSDRRERAAAARLSERRLTPDTLEETRRELLDDLRRDGHRRARVEVQSTDLEEGRLRIIRFSLAPGPRFSIGTASARGVPPGEAETVSAVLSPLRAGMPFREREWSATVDGLRRALRRRGFFQAEVEPEIVPAPPEAGTLPLELIVRIDAGPAATVGEVRFEGRGPFPPAELLEISGLQTGSPYVAEEIVTARKSLESFYRNRGFLEAVLEVQVPVDPVSHRAEVRFQIHRGDYFTVGGIVIAGLEATRESAVRGRLPFEEGDPLGREDILEVRRRLVAMGIFRTVEVTLLDPEEPVSERNVLIRVVEGPRTSIGYGAGYSEREQIRGEAEWTRNNLFGRNHTLSLFARLSLKGNRIVATYRGAENVAGNVPVFISAFREAQDRESLDFVRTGVGVQFTRRVLGRDLFFRYDFTTSELSDLKIHPNQIDRSFADDLWLSSISVSAVSDTRDDPVDPREGRFGIVDLKWSSALLGSRAPFIKGLGQQYLFFPLGGQVVFAAAGRLGMAWTMGDDAPALVPITERFFAGGATTLRGFRLDRGGPLDESGYPLGGNLLIIGNLEVRFPIFGSLRGAVFSDHGGVYGEVRTFRFRDLRHDVGAGLRWNTPLGPVRFDYGIRIGDIGDGRRGQWHFTIGHAF